MKNLNCSETKLNLMRAFAGECQSRQRYYQAALLAQEKNEIVLERMFRFTAEQEERHAKQFFELLKEGAEVLKATTRITRLIAIAFTVIVNFIVHFKLKKIDMATSLKSVE